MSQKTLSRDFFLDGATRAALGEHRRKKDHVLLSAALAAGPSLVPASCCCCVVAAVLVDVAASGCEDPVVSNFLAPSASASLAAPGAFSALAVAAAGFSESTEEAGSIASHSASTTPEALG